MKKILFICLLCASAAISFAQKETFDLATYTPPKAWKKQSDKNGVQFTKEDAKGTYCVISLLKAVPGTDNAKENFDLAWESVVKEMVTVTVAPEMQAPSTENGWEMQSGYAGFELEGNKGIVMLVTASAAGKMVNLVVLTNTDVYQKNITAFVESISLKKLQQTAVVNSNVNQPVLGTWGVSSTVASMYNYSINEGSIVKQYTFTPGGTYTFYIKTFQYQLDKLLLTKEKGTYKINGNSITIIPTESATEAWTKKDGTDKWGKFISSNKRELEKITYQFSVIDAGSGMTLVMKASKVTKRDGPFNNGDKDAWFYPSKRDIEIIKLPGEEQKTTQEIKKQPVPGAIKDGFTFTTTNFDDGWTSVVQKDWVQVTKGATMVLIHYPNKQADDYNPDLMGGLKNAWNVLVAPKYSTASNLEFRPISNWQSIEFAEADAVEKATNKKVYVVLFKINYSGGNGKYLEFITPDKNSFEQEFGAYHASSSGWEKMEVMANYNRFAIAASDLTGQWTSNFSGTTQYVNSQTGMDAGMNTHASVENFQIGPGNTYKWDISVASGFVGNIKFQGAKSNGRFSMVGNWQISFTDIEGKPRTYNACFSCIKGLRILWLDGKAFAKKE